MESKPPDKNAPAGTSATICYDDTSIEIYIDQIRQRLISEPRLTFTDLFVPDMIKSQLAGIFLAILELIRYHHIQIELENLFGEI